MDILNNILDYIYNGNMDDLEYIEFMVEYLFIFIYFLILGVVGIIGNFYVFFVYFLCYKLLNYWIFILCLVVVDFCLCIVSIFFEMYDIRYRYIFIVFWVCKVFWFFNYIISVFFGFFFGLIVLERFWKVC